MIDEPFSDTAADSRLAANESPVQRCCADVARFFRESPVGSVLVAIGLGVFIGVLARAFGTRPRESRAERVLRDIQERIQETLAPAYKRATQFAADGANAVKDGVEQLEDLDLDRRFRKAGKKLRSFFS